jgi:hypothetical protein
MALPDPAHSSFPSGMTERKTSTTTKATTKAKSTTNEKTTTTEVR